MAANVILKYETSNDDAMIALLTTPMQVDINQVDSFRKILANTLPLFVLIAFIPPVYNNMFLIVKEKESRMKESMRIMGMKDSSYWLSWYSMYT